MDTAAYIPDISWSHGGRVNPSAADSGKPWSAPVDLTLDAVILMLESVSDVALSVDTVIDGAVQRTDTIDPEAHVVSHPLGVPMKAGQTLHPVLLPVPTGTGVGLRIAYRCSRA